jgi:hypothetical protein
VAALLGQTAGLPDEENSIYRRFEMRRTVSMVALFMFLAFGSAYADLNYTTIDVSGSTWPEAIQGGNIVGSCGPAGAQNFAQGFLYNITSGTTSFFSIPGTSNIFATGLSGNNIVGSYEYPHPTGTVAYQGYVYNYNTATFTYFNAGGNWTAAGEMDGNNVVGTYAPGYTEDPFLYNIASQTFSYLPGYPDANLTQGHGISGSNIVATYATNSGDYGFIYNIATGAFTPINVPFAGASNTNPMAIDGSNVVGSYYDANGNLHSFLYNMATGTYTNVDVPFVGAYGTYVDGISGDDIVGTYYDANGVEHGFLATETPTPIPGAIFLVVPGLAILTSLKRKYL